MLKNYIKYALRYLIKNKSFSLINIFGLTIGIASFLLIINFVQYEKSYDHYIDDLDNVYRINLVRNATGAKAAAIGPPMAPAMKDEFPEIKNYVRFRHANNVLVRVDEEEFYENSIFFVDSTFLDVFNFPLVYGDPTTALNGQNQAIITREMANKFWGSENPVGEVISINDELNLTISGVVGKPGTPSHFEFGMLITFSSFEVPFGYPVTLDTWGWTSFPSYVQLHPGTDPESVNVKFPDFIGSHMSERAVENINLELQPVSKIHLHSKDISERDGIPTKGDIKYVNILTAIAYLILGLAIFNFTNLSTTLSLKRVREVGVRKTLGAVSQAVFWQYMIESLIITLIGILLAITLLEIFNEPLGNLFGIQLSIIDYLSNSWYRILLITIGIGLAGGIYPAIFLSRFRPAVALKSKIASNSSKFSLKSLLVGVQFIITIGLLAGSIVIFKQMQFLQNRDLGFEKEQIVSLQVQGETLTQTYELTRQRLLRSPYIEAVSASGNMFDGQNGSVPVVDGSNAEGEFRISLFGANYGFGEMMELEFVEGRDFSEQFPNDSSGFILNEAAVEMFGWEDSALGKQLTVNVWEGEVIGVVKDFHFASLHEAITPLVIMIPQTHVDNIFVKLKSGSISEALASVKSEWDSLYPNFPFDYTFLDDHIGRMYEADQSFSKLVYVFSMLAITLACLGLFGIIAYNINTRMKEIGIRKVLGASIGQVVVILSRQYMILITLAALIGLPAAWHLLQDWLAGFAYRIELNVVYFALAVVITLLVAFLTMSLKTIAAAMTNPANTLKEE